jgi:cellulose synthase/poly-beta-1,6-N-acetylglucosamine synthase-like glycosyltransferase
MIARSQRSTHTPSDSSVACECGYAAPRYARNCRRCGRRLVSDGASADAPNPALIRTLSGWERLPRPVRRVPVAPRALAQAIPGRRARFQLPDEQSARNTFTRAQVVVARLAIATALLILAINAVALLIALVFAATVLYLGALGFRMRAFVGSLSDPDVITVSDEEARAIWDRTLPIYTVLVPAYREPEVIGDLLDRIGRFEYPADRLDVKLLLEEDDEETILAAEAAAPGHNVEILRIPYTEPRTKPKALNVGLAQARGAASTGLVTIYDAEDRPDPLQLRRAVAAFRRVGPSVACLQAKLAYHNGYQNLITRWFTVEYAMWFSQLLPGLVRQGTPLPLGGTSNHFRRSVLESVGAWDPYNVTEDADIGIRLHRAGYRTQVLDTVTLEEANSDFVNWVKQRSRWYKGYMQTWLVHMRHPRRLWRDVGAWGFIGFNLFVGGTPLLALLNPVFWVLTVSWFVFHPDFIVALFPAWLYYVSLLCLLLGNFAFVYASMVAARAAGPPALVIAALLSPVYWVMMSIAAIKAVIQLFHAPSFWEKTSHGLDRAGDERVHGHAAA